MAPIGLKAVVGERRGLIRVLSPL
uniref:Syntaxin binding protein 1 n=1 Tax=Propithecus coquereli TaxID=379532 RepID=A0A2K6ETL1_PROCO